MISLPLGRMPRWLKGHFVWGNGGNIAVEHCTSCVAMDLFFKLCASSPSAFTRSAGRSSPNRLQRLPMPARPRPRHHLSSDFARGQHSCSELHEGC
eukprot:10481994-Alexandrium_andersonii.AAC.1